MSVYIRLTDFYYDNWDIFLNKRVHYDFKVIEGKHRCTSYGHLLNISNTWNYWHGKITLVISSECRFRLIALPKSDGWTLNEGLEKVAYIYFDNVMTPCHEFFDTVSLRFLNLFLFFVFMF